MTVFAVMSCSDDTLNQQSDTAAPDPVTTLGIVGNVDTLCTLTWTATGDDNFSGVASSYAIRYATDSSLLVDWSGGREVDSLPVPLAPGTLQEWRFGGLIEESTYFFAIRVIDDAGNISPVSNIVREPANPAPFVTLISPLNGESIGDYVLFSAEVSETTKVAAVEFYVGDSLVGSDFTIPYELFWMVPWDQQDFQFLVYARVRNTEGAVRGSSGALCLVDSLLFPPPKPQIKSLGTPTATTLGVCWDPCREPDFQGTVVYYKCPEDSIRRYSATIGSPTDTTLLINGLFDGSSYWMVVSVWDTRSHRILSDTLRQTTLNAAPFPVVVAVTEQAEDHIRIGWAPSSSHDVGRYQVARRNANTMLSWEMLALLEVTDSNFYDDYSAIEGADYEYSVITVDTFGLESISNVVKARLLAATTQGYALLFDNDRCEIPYYAAFNVGTTYTLEAWVRPANNVGILTILNKIVPEWRFQYSLILRGLRLELWSCVGDARRVVASTVPMKPDAWHHVAAVNDHGKVSLYLNGNKCLVDSAGSASNCEFVTGLAIGHYYGNYPFYGAIDELRIWNTARTDDEIFQAYDSSLAGDEQGLVSYFRFDEGSSDFFWGIDGQNGHLGSEVLEDPFDPIWIPSSAPIKH